MSLEAGRPVKFTSISLLDKLESLCYEISEKQRLIIKDNVQTPEYRGGGNRQIYQNIELSF